MSAWEGKPCAKCGGNKGPKYATKKHCGKCKYIVAKERSRKAHGKRIENEYGITRTDYDDVKAIQGGVCAICLRANGRTKRLSVDHDHETGFVRGLLCSLCNKMLGHSRDSIEFFERAAEYLRNPPARAILYKKD